MTAPLPDVEVPAAPLWTLPDDARVALVSPYGGGNLGDAAILESAIYGIRRRLPRAEIFGLTLNPAATTDRHGIPAYPCTGVRLRYYRATNAVRRRDDGAAPSDSEEKADASPIAALKRAARAVPGLQQLRTFGQSVAGDLRHRRSAARWLAGCRLILVAGGGQVDDYWGGAFGHPYVLWELSSLARRLVARALAAADYVSFRDQGSMSRSAFAGAAGRVVPDLAYGLPWRKIVDANSPPASRARPPASARPPRVALSPMSYCAPDLWPEVHPDKYERHVGTVVELGARMLEAGWEVVLVHSDSNDRVPVRDVAKRLGARVGPEQRARVETRATDRLPELLDALAGVDLMIAARLHGVILAHVVGRPVLALSYERKVATVMREMDHMEHCLELETMDPAQAFGKVEAMLEKRAVLEADVQAKASARRAAVEAQWDRLFTREART